MGNALENKLVARSWKDPIFRQTVITKPVSTLKAMGIDLDQQKFSFAKKTNGKWVIDLPDSPVKIKKINPQDWQAGPNKPDSITILVCTTGCKSK